MALTTTFIERISMGHYSHLSIEEREDIMVWWKNHESISQIARKLGRNKSSISREIKRNGWTIIGVAHLCYRASTAQRKTDVRRQACTKRTHFSPEQIAGRLHLELSYAPVSCSTIYRAIHSGKLDCELPGVQSVRRRLRHRGKRWHTKHLIERRGKIRITHELVERPKEVADRQRIGDWGEIPSSVKLKVHAWSHKLTVWAATLLVAKLHQGLVPMSM